MHNNEKVTENLKMRLDIDFGWISSLFMQLYRFIHYWEMDEKNIVNVTKLVKKLVLYSLVLGINKYFCQDHIWIKGREPIYKPTNERKP